MDFIRTEHSEKSVLGNFAVVESNLNTIYDYFKDFRRETWYWNGEGFKLVKQYILDMYNHVLDYKNGYHLSEDITVDNFDYDAFIHALNTTIRYVKIIKRSIGRDGEIKARDSVNLLNNLYERTEKENQKYLEVLPNYKNK